MKLKTGAALVAAFLVGVTPISAGFNFGAIFSVTKLPHHAARSMI
jgi:hypothetical protein